MKPSGARKSGQPAREARIGRVRIGISGWVYPRWRGVFYPPDVRARDELAFASRRFDTIEINGTFYSLRAPADFRRWRDETPDDFVFAIKGSRFITHNLKLARAEGPLANFFASGILALGAKTGPFLWQLPPGYGFDRDRVEAFLRLLPRDDRGAARLARGHDDRLRRGALARAPRGTPVPYRHAVEVRHPSYLDPAFFALMREYEMGFVVADSAGKFPYAEEVTADFVYARLHGASELYVSGYSDPQLARWADRCAAWARRGLDVFVFFDNDAKVHAPHNAERLRAMVTLALARVEE